MMSRLMLNLHGSVSGREIVTTPISDSSGPSDNSTSLLFTTRISMPPISMIATTSDQEAARYRDRESAYVRDARAGYDHGYIEEVYEMQDTHYRDRDDTPLQVSLERRLGGDANDKRGW